LWARDDDSAEVLATIRVIGSQAASAEDVMVDCRLCGGTGARWRWLAVLVLLVGLLCADVGGPSGPAESLDPTFGGDGKVVTAFGAGYAASGVELQTDGKFRRGGLQESRAAAAPLISRSRATSRTAASTRHSTTTARC
jgi:hypothetical protein